MKTSRILMFVIAVTMCTAACSNVRHVSRNSSSSQQVVGNGKYVTKKVAVGDFTSVNVSGAFNIVYTQKSGKPKVEIYGEENIVGLVKAGVKGGRLELKFADGSNCSFHRLEVRISSSRLRSFERLGSGDFRIDGNFTTDRFKASVCGSGNFRFDDMKCDGLLDITLTGSGDVRFDGIDATKVDLSIAGSGDAKLSGRSREANYSVAGSGDVDATGVAADDVKASVAGSGDIKCYARRTFEANVEGSGSIGYQGNPQLNIPEDDVRQGKIRKL